MMKIGLSWKLFGVLLLNAAVIVGVMAGAIHFSVSRNFEEYVREFDRERFEAVAGVLEAEYAESQSWKLKGQSPQRWLRGLGFRTPSRSYEFLQLGFPGPDMMISPEWIFLGKGLMQEHQMMRRRLPLRRRNGEPQIRHSRPNSTNNGGTREMLILMDAEQKPLWGPELKRKPDLFKALHHQGQVVGWLGMVTEGAMEQSRHAHFLKQQQRMLKILAVAAVLTAALIAFLLSRYLLRPVRKLTEGTLAIAERLFDTRVKINSSDEFGQLATDFNAMAKTLDSFEQQRQQWISDISHELGTPLSVLRGEIEAMQDGIRQPNPERFESLHAEVLHLARIVDDLKLLSRAEAGQLNLCKVELDPVKLLQQALEQYADRLAERGITIQNKLPQQSGKTAMVDPDRLRQVFLNLLENVVRYVNSPATLTAQSKNTEDSLTLILEDSGQGVTEEALTNLFDRFYRTDFSRNRETGGSGLGLAICKNLIETHGGSIHAESVEPHGLRIVIKIDTAVDLE